MAKAIDSETAYQFLTGQLVKETGAFSKGVNKGLNIAQSAMRNPDAIPTLTPQNEPLTLEQLREMDRQPVWVHVIDHTVFADKEDDFDGWGMCRKSWVRIWDSKRADIVHIDYDFEDYGKEWLAYAYPSAHIDREAWEPCDLCQSCGNCEHNMGYECSREMELGKKNCEKFEPASNFCWKCGRPLTEEAWAELEKRLRGNYNG